jgi:hypothetical protein
MPKHHDLKLFEKYYQPVVDSRKCSEVRYNDRNYHIGDTITLHEGKPGLNGFEYTGRTISALISYIDDFGLNTGYVNLSIKLIDASEVVK